MREVPQLKFLSGPASGPVCEMREKELKDRDHRSKNCAGTHSIVLALKNTNFVNQIIGQLINLPFTVVPALHPVLLFIPHFC